MTFSTVHPAMFVLKVIWVIEFLVFVFFCFVFFKVGQR